MGNWNEWKWELATQHSAKIRCAVDNKMLSYLRFSIPKWKWEKKKQHIAAHLKWRASHRKNRTNENVFVGGGGVEDEWWESGRMVWMDGGGGETPRKMADNCTGVGANSKGKWTQCGRFSSRILDGSGRRSELKTSLHWEWKRLKSIKT